MFTFEIIEHLGPISYTKNTSAKCEQFKLYFTLLLPTMRSEVFMVMKFLIAVFFVTVLYSLVRVSHK